MISWQMVTAKGLLEIIGQAGIKSLVSVLKNLSKQVVNYLKKQASREKILARIKEFKDGKSLLRRQMHKMEMNEQNTQKRQS